MQISRLTLTSLIFTCLGIFSGAAVTSCLPYQDKIPFWVLIILGTSSAACPVIALAIQKFQPIQLTKEGKIKDYKLIRNK